MLDETVTSAKGEVLRKYTYTLDEAGRRTKVVESGKDISERTVQYTFDSLGRLEKETVTENGKTSTVSYTFDNLSNRISKNDNGTVTKYTYDANNRLLTEGNMTYTYDKNGNTVTKTENGVTTTYTYFVFGRLKSVSDGTTTESYDYNYQGGRISKTTNGNTTNYLLDDSGQVYNVLAEYDDAVNATSIYTYGTDMISIDNSGAVSYYLTDGQGSTRALTDENGIITDTYTYDAFGNVTAQTGDAYNPYLYNQEQYDANTGLYYLRARYMNPSTGRFISMDAYSGSIYDPMSLHKYLYANSNPIAYTDPTGYFSLAEMDVCTAIQDILDNATKVNYVKIFNTINDALSAYDFVRTVYDSVINGESIEQVAMSLAIGAITSVAINKCAIFQNPLVKKIMSCMFATMGIGGEAQGIYEAIENEDYDLAITRSVQLAMTLTSALFFNCFTGETLVATEDGHKRIDEIEVGDLVWSANVETGEVELKEVTEVFVREDNVLVHLIIDGNVINTTALHPFYVVDKGWIEAIEINVGDKVLLQNGSTVTVDDKTVEQFNTPIKVYNFTVDDFHAYFVVEDCVLVHNAEYKTTSQNQMQKQVEKGHAPKGIDRVDPAHETNGQPHIHFGDNDAALNMDGTWHDAGKKHPDITNKVKKWIEKNGWKLPIE